MRGCTVKGMLESLKRRVSPVFPVLTLATGLSWAAVSAEVSIRDRVYVWGYQLDRTPTACPFVFGKTSVSLDSAVRLLGAEKAIYMNSMFNRGFIEKNFPDWDRECFENCIDGRLSDTHFAALKDVPEIWCALEHLRREESALEIARLSLKYPNIAGINLDDFNDSNPNNAMSPEALAALRRSIREINPKLKISIVTYGDRPGITFDVTPYAESIDMVSRWKWQADTNYWTNFRAETAALRREVGDRVKIVQGLYLHDFGKGLDSRDPLPFDIFTNSVATAFGAVREGWLDGVILPQVGWYSSPLHACHVSWLRNRLGGETRAAIATPRYDWAKGLYLYSLNEMLRAVRGQDFDAVIFGDSITMGWIYPETDKGWPGGREVWDRHFGNLKTANFGVSGDRTEHVLWRIEREGQADGWTAKRIYLMIGINNSHQLREGDLEPDTPAQAFEGAKAVVAALAKRHPESEIVVLGVLPWAAADGAIRPWGAEYNRLLRTLAGGKVRFRDIGGAFLGPDGRQRPGLFRDRLHPSPAGYEVFAEQLSEIGTPASTVSLNGTWSFSKDGGPFEPVEVPHDWAIGGPFDPNGNGGTGKLPWCADGEYRRKFTIGKKPEAARLEFDGVMSWPEVFVNGVRVGGWDYGYLGFTCEVTEVIREGENEVVVKATTKPHRSRWYPGGGIYRDVRLVCTARDHVVPGSVYIRATAIGKDVASVECDWEMSVGGKRHRTVVIEHPRFWDIEDPFLYEIELGGEKFRYGIRRAEFTVDDGFHLNGRRVQLNGVNLHSDLGPLGMAFDRDAAKRQLLIMKDLGVNAIRTSHNPPDPKFLDLCDEMGFLVWDEGFDKWNETAARKPEQKLEEYVVRNLKAFVRRDRNHPSVICWSISNEIGSMKGKYGNPDSMTKERVRIFREAVRSEDPTRPVTAGLADPHLVNWDETEGLDLAGWNYEHSYAAFRAKYPKVPVVYSESASAVSSQGYCQLPVSTSKVDFRAAAMKADGYELQSAWCGDIADVEFNRLDHDRYVAGEFVWTGMDYLGEPCPFCYVGRPDCWPGEECEESRKPRSSYFGIVDLIGNPKNRYWLYRSRWNRKSETVAIVPGHWNFGGGRLPVEILTSGDEAELFLNGRSLGRRAKAKDIGEYPLDFAGRNPEPSADYRGNGYYRVCAKYRIRFDDVAYEPGTLRAVVYRDGRKIGETEVKTAGAFDHLKVEEDPFTPEGSSLRFFKVSAVDADGVLVPDADFRVSYELKGEGRILAVANADECDFDSFAKTGGRRLYAGRALVIARPGTVGSRIGLRATRDR